MALMLVSSVLSAECGSNPVSNCEVTTPTTFNSSLNNPNITVTASADIDGSNAIIGNLIIVASDISISNLQFTQFNNNHIIVVDGSYDNLMFDNINIVNVDFDDGGEWKAFELGGGSNIILNNVDLINTSFIGGSPVGLIIDNSNIINTKTSMFAMVNEPIGEDRDLDGDEAYDVRYNNDGGVVNDYIEVHDSSGEGDFIGGLAYMGTTAIDCNVYNGSYQINYDLTSLSFTNGTEYFCLNTTTESKYAIGIYYFEDDAVIEYRVESDGSFLDADDINDRYGVLEGDISNLIINNSVITGNTGDYTESAVNMKSDFIIRNSEFNNFANPLVVYQTVSDAIVQSNTFNLLDLGSALNCEENVMNNLLFDDNTIIGVGSGDARVINVFNCEIYTANIINNNISDVNFGFQFYNIVSGSDVTFDNNILSGIGGNGIIINNINNLYITNNELSGSTNALNIRSGNTGNVLIYGNNINGNIQDWNTETIWCDYNTKTSNIYFGSYSGGNFLGCVEYDEFTAIPDFASYDDYWWFVNMSIENTFGIITFGLDSVIDLTGDTELDFDTYVEISNKSIYVDSVNLPEFNISSILTFKNVGTDDLEAITVYRDGVECLNTTCTNLRLETGDFLVDVTGFSNYSIEVTESGYQAVYGGEDLTVITGDFLGKGINSLITLSPIIALAIILVFIGVAKRKKIRF